MGKRIRSVRAVPDPVQPPSLQVGEAVLRAVLDAIPARVALYDRERRHRYVNRAYADFVGRAPEEVVGLTLAEVMGADTYAKVESFYLQLRPHSARALAGEASRWEGWLPFNVENRHAYATRFYFPYRGPSGAVDGYFVFARDLTELKRSEALSAAITEAALDAIIVSDEAGGLVSFNAAAERCFGLDAAAAIGRRIGDLVDCAALRTIGPDRVLACGEDALRGCRMEAAALRADGTRFPSEVAIAEVRLPDRRLFATYLRDLTAARAAAAEIARQREALLQSEKLAALGSLLAGVAHELNNPLSIVLAGALMLQEDLEAAPLPELARRAERIRTAGERCARIVRSFLAMARQQETQRRSVAVAPLIEAALDLLAYGLRSDGIAVTQDLPPGLPPVLGDPDQLHQVLTNLLTNARQALEARAGGRRIAITARDLGATVEVAIADNGPGVAPDIRRRIFDPFFTTKPVGIGTGIGLAVSRGIVEAHGGTLELDEMAAGRGSRFVLRLPRATAAIAAAATDAAAPSAMLQGRALVIDDEPAIAAMLAELLQAMGLNCERATSGRRARRMLAAHDYAVILCDLRMPDGGGEALHAWLERRRPALGARLAFITGAVMAEGTRALLARTGRPLLEKPFTPRDVRELVAQLLEGAG